MSKSIEDAKYKDLGTQIDDIRDDVNPESPSFNRKILRESIEDAKYNDIYFWSSKPVKIDDIHDDGTFKDEVLPPQKQQNDIIFQDRGEKLISLKEIAPDLLDFRGLGVNGTVRRFKSPVTTAPVKEQVQVMKVTEQASAFVPTPLKRSISQNFVKDAVEKSLSNPIINYENSDKNDSEILRVINKVPEIQVIRREPYLTPRALESIGSIALTTSTLQSSRTIQQQEISTRLSPARVSPKTRNSLSPGASNSASLEKNATSEALSLGASNSASLEKNAASEGTFSGQDEEPTEDSSHKTEKFWFKLSQIFRSVSMATHTWVTTYPGLSDPRVRALNGNGLLIAVLIFATFDVVLSVVKAFPKNFWCCWQVRGWDPVKLLGTVWAIIADHALLLDLVPMFFNISLRIYSLSELVQNPQAINSISNNGFSVVSDWTNPVYSNFVQLILWGVTIAATLLFHTFLRVRFFTFKYANPALGLMIIVKASLLLLDMCAGSLFLYTFLVSLGVNIFGTSPDIPLMLSVMAASPVISTIGNSFVNVPLMYAFGRLQKGVSSLETMKGAIAKVFSPASLIFNVLVAFYICVTGYLLNELHIVTISSVSSDLVNLVTWSPSKSVIWLIGVNFALNYLLGMAFTIIFWSFKVISHFVVC